MSEFVNLVPYMTDYVSLLQVAAVTGVACALIINTTGDLYATEPTGGQEVGTGVPVQAQKYRGRLANTCRVVVFGVSGLLAFAYTALLCAIIASAVVISIGRDCADPPPVGIKSASLLMLMNTAPSAASVPTVAKLQLSQSPQPSDIPPPPVNEPMIVQHCFSEYLLQRLPWTSAELKVAVFRPTPLREHFVIVVALTILAVCWIAFLATILRSNHMRRPGVI